MVKRDPKADQVAKAESAAKVLSALRATKVHLEPLVKKVFLAQLDSQEFRVQSANPAPTEARASAANPEEMDVLAKTATQVAKANAATMDQTVPTDRLDLRVEMVVLALQAVLAARDQLATKASPATQVIPAGRV